MADGPAAVRLSDGPCFSLSRDGQTVICEVDGQLRQVPTGTGESKVLTHDSFLHPRYRWLPGDKAIIFAGQEPGHDQRIYVQQLGGDPRSVTPEGTRSYSAVSNDGRWLAVSVGAFSQLPGANRN